MFYNAAVDLPDVNFALTQNNDVITKYGLTHDVVLLLKKVHFKYNISSGQVAVFIYLCVFFSADLVQGMGFKCLNCFSIALFICLLVCVCVFVCLLQSKLIQAYKMTPETSKEMLMIFITVYQMDPITEYTGQVEYEMQSTRSQTHCITALLPNLEIFFFHVLNITIIYCTFSKKCSTTTLFSDSKVCETERWIYL